MLKDEKIIKSLEFLQGIITRLNTNSFSIKCFAITVFGLLVTLYIEKGNILYIYADAICVIIFALMDSMYLNNERKFRKIYDTIINNSNDEDLKVFLYSTKSVKNTRFIQSLFSFSIQFVYLSLLVPLIVVIIISFI